MIHRFIASDFQIDLSGFQISIVEENPWFSDTFSTKYTFPIEMELDDELMHAFGYLLESRYEGGETLFNGTYVHNDKMESAIFEVEEIVGRRITASFRYGFDELPSFSKKLSELSLDKFELPDGVSIYNYAATIIPQTWPAVNFNFPQIHTDKFDTDQDEWFAFEKIINNYKDGAFPINEVIDDITYNRNVIQPLPYYLHILTQGFADAGKILMGNITNDPVFRKKVLYADTDYVTTVDQESYPILLMGSDATIVSGKANYLEEITIANPGRYRVIGKVYLKLRNSGSVFFKIKYRDAVLAQFSTSMSPGGPIPLVMKLNVNFVFDTISDLQPNLITFESTQQPATDNFLAVDLNINPIRLHDDSGEAIATVINQNEVDLTRAVPDITFRDFVTYIKNKYNVGLEPRGENEIWMNFVQKEIAIGDAINLSAYEVALPVKKFNRGISFLLKFQDVDSPDYTFQSVFQSATEISNSGYTTDEKTVEITLDGLPLPLLVRNNVQTAHAFMSGGGSTLYSILYDGLTMGLNIAKDPTDILLPAIHERHHKQWFDDRITAATYKWPFKMTPEALRELTNKGKVFAYGRNQIVRTLNKTQIETDVWDIDIESDTLK